MSETQQAVKSTEEDRQKALHNPTTNLATIDLSRSEDGSGVTLVIKSPLFEEFFRSRHNGNVHDMETYAKANAAGWAPHRGYGLASYTDGLEKCKEWGGQLFTGTACNLAFFRARGLSEGVTFKLEGMYSQTQMEKWLTEAKDALNKIYREHIKKTAYLMTISLTEIAES